MDNKRRYQCETYIGLRNRTDSRKAVRPTYRVPHHAVNILMRNCVNSVTFFVLLLVRRCGELAVIQLVIKAVLCEQLAVRALLDDISVLHNEYLIRLEYG